MLSKKAQYALKALGYLTEKYPSGTVQTMQAGPAMDTTPTNTSNTAFERPVLISEISVEKQIPIKFLESILLQLKNADILGSRKGKGGGYFLKQHPSTISVARVLRIIDGPIAMLPCVSLYFYKKCEDCTEKSCRINKMFSEVRDATLHILEKRTLLDLAAQSLF